jgi:hypothetical protein
MAGPSGSSDRASALNAQVVTPAGKSPCAAARFEWNAPTPSATNIQLSDRLIITASGVVGQRSHAD